jgi:hypothetical protein|tara:strand:- start:1959 stop:2234 length:276 start_codon:yes stop_codon:yes gene_type:complete
MMRTKTKTKSVAAHKKVAKKKYRTAKTRIAKVADSVRPGRPPLPLNKLKVRVSYTLAPKIQKALRRAARQERRTQVNIVETALSRFLKIKP